MKKKTVAEPIVSPEILQMAKRAIELERPTVVKRCGVCGGSCTPLTGPQLADDLCWVCRRLKISAWRESDPQMSAQE
jgi:hypothetical protein